MMYDMDNIIEIVDIKVFVKHDPTPCNYCEFVMDYCCWANKNGLCPKCGLNIDSVCLNRNDISSSDENIRT